MKNLLSLGTALLVGLVIGRTSLNLFPVANAVPAVTLDKYELHWIGSTGKNFIGNYIIQDSVNGLPPKKLSFSFRKGATIVISGNAKTLKIYKNGRECGQTIVVIVQPEKMSSKVCSQQ